MRSMKKPTCWLKRHFQPTQVKPYPSFSSSLLVNLINSTSLYLTRWHQQCYRILPWECRKLFQWQAKWCQLLRPRFRLRCRTRCSPRCSPRCNLRCRTRCRSRCRLRCSPRYSLKFIQHIKHRLLLLNHKQCQVIIWASTYRLSNQLSRILKWFSKCHHRTKWHKFNRSGLTPPILFEWWQTNRKTMINNQTTSS